MHKNPTQGCQTCLEKIKECHSSLNLWFEIIADNFRDCHIAVGFRGELDQDKALKEHLTHAPWPLSKHNKIENGKPCSWAMDLFRLGDDGLAYFEENYFKQIWNLINHIQVESGDQEIYWGGLFTNLKDFDHFELLKVEMVQSISILSQDKC